MSQVVWTEIFKSERFELELEEFTRNLVRRSEHSAMTAYQSLWLCRCLSLYLELLCDLFSLSHRTVPYSLFWTFRWVDVLSTGDFSQSEKFELVQEDRIWFPVIRSNDSAMTAWFILYFCPSVNVCWTAVWIFSFWMFYVKVNNWEFLIVWCIE